MHCLQVKGMAEKLGVHINWKGRQDHLDPVLQDYQVCPTSLRLRRCCLPASWYRRQQQVSIAGCLHVVMASRSVLFLQVFINASTSDVVATTSMEALAMGKWLICAQHPCNAFVGTFSNCLIYRSPEEFSKHLEHALKEQPPPLSPSELRYTKSSSNGGLSFMPAQGSTAFIVLQKVLHAGGSVMLVRT